MENMGVALIGAVGVIFAALIPALLLRSGQKDLRAQVGQTNGKGSIAEMNERQLEQIEAVRRDAARHAELDSFRFRALHEHLGIPFHDDKEIP